MNPLTHATSALVYEIIGISKRSFERRAAKENFPYSEKCVRGGKLRWYPISGLPKAWQTAVKEALLTKALNTPLPAALAAVSPISSTDLSMPSAQPAGALKDWQKRIAEARAALLNEVDRSAAIVGREKAIRKMVDMVSNGTLPPHLAALVPQANARSSKSGKCTLSRRTLYTWMEGAAIAPP